MELGLPIRDTARGSPFLDVARQLSRACAVCIDEAA
jgi:hypothetical protein